MISQSATDPSSAVDAIIADWKTEREVTKELCPPCTTECRAENESSTGMEGCRRRYERREEKVNVGVYDSAYVDVRTLANGLTYVAE